MGDVFKALSDKQRRGFLDLLLKNPGLTLNELCRSVSTSRQSVSKHLQILEDANLVVIHWRGREKLHYLNPVPIAEISDRWINKFSKEKSNALINLKQALNESEEG